MLAPWKEGFALSSTLFLYLPPNIAHIEINICKLNTFFITTHLLPVIPFTPMKSKHKAHPIILSL